MKRGKKGFVSIYVPTRTGLVQRSCGTSEKLIVRELKRLCTSLKGHRRWTILDAVRDNRLTLPTLWDRREDLDALEAELSAPNLVDYLDAWQRWVVAQHGNERTGIAYRRTVDSLVQAPTFLATEMKPARITAWLATFDVSTGTRRGYLYNLKSFVSYLMAMGVYEHDPLSGLDAPKANAHRLRYETEENDRRLVNATSTRYRALFAFIHATGAEHGAAMNPDTRVRDLDLTRGVARVRGTKTASRDRHEVVIERWALPILKAHVRTRLPNARLFDAIPRRSVQCAHRAVCKAVGIEDYRLHDARHSVAVRMRKAGRSFEDIGAQLGHTDGYMAAKVYGVFKPTIEERLKSTTKRATSR